MPNPHQIPNQTNKVGSGIAISLAFRLIKTCLKPLGSKGSFYYYCAAVTLSPALDSTPFPPMSSHHHSVLPDCCFDTCCPYYHHHLCCCWDEGLIPPPPAQPIYLGFLSCWQFSLTVRFPLHSWQVSECLSPSQEPIALLRVISIMVLAICQG